MAIAPTHARRGVRRAGTARMRSQCGRCALRALVLQCFGCAADVPDLPGATQPPRLLGTRRSNARVELPRRLPDAKHCLVVGRHRHGRLGGVIVGAFLPDTYGRDVVLQLGGVALLLVPVLLVERSIAERLARESRASAAMQRTEMAIERDQFFRDYGQKLAHRWRPIPREVIDDRLSADGWRRGRDARGYAIWGRAGETLAIPLGPQISAPVVRSVVRATGWDTDGLADPDPWMAEADRQRAGES